MNESEKARFRDKLKTLLSEIEEYLEKSKDSAEAVSPDKGLGRLSRMEAMQDQQMVLELRRRRKRRKLEVINALTRWRMIGSEDASFAVEKFPGIDWMRFRKCKLAYPALELCAFRKTASFEDASAQSMLISMTKRYFTSLLTNLSRARLI